MGLALAILGALVIDRGRSDGPDDGLTAGSAVTSGDGGMANPGSGTGPDGVLPTDPTWDLCKLLTEPIAEGVSGSDMEHFETPTDQSDRWCRYTARLGHKDTRGVNLDIEQRTWFGCPDEECSSKQHEAVPTLPDGEYWWYGEPEPGYGADYAVWVEWSVAGRTWALWYSDFRPLSDTPQAGARKDALIAAAEEIHDLALQGVGLQ